MRYIYVIPLSLLTSPAFACGNPMLEGEAGSVGSELWVLAAVAVAMLGGASTVALAAFGLIAYVLRGQTA